LEGLDTGVGRGTGGDVEGSDLVGMLLVGVEVGMPTVGVNCVEGALTGAGAMLPLQEGVPQVSSSPPQVSSSPPQSAPPPPPPPLGLGLGADLGLGFMALGLGAGLGLGLGFGLDLPPPPPHVSSSPPPHVSSSPPPHVPSLLLHVPAELGAMLFSLFVLIGLCVGDLVGLGVRKGGVGLSVGGGVFVSS
jgi:hypothetical protein